MPPTTAVVRTVFALAAACVVAGCGGDPRADAAVRDRPRTARPAPFADVQRLVDDTFDILAQPGLVSRDEQGRLLVADASEKNIKIYDSAGRRVATFGRAGTGKGEFVTLLAGQSVGDGAIAYDFVLQRFTIFDAAGRVSRVVKPAYTPYTLRVVDDSLLLLVRHPGQSGQLLALAHLDGSVITEFLDGARLFQNPGLRYHSAVYADACDGFVFAAVFGLDSMFVFDYTGRQLAAAPIRASMALERLDDLLRRNGGVVQNGDGSYFHNGMHAVMGLVALPGGGAAVQVAAYDTRLGTNLLVDTSEIVTMHLDSLLRVVPGDDRPVRGLAAGRDVDGTLLLVAYADSQRKDLEVRRVRSR